jgi:hypothetical protein
MLVPEVLSNIDKFKQITNGVTMRSLADQTGEIVIGSIPLHVLLASLR